MLARLVGALMILASIPVTALLLSTLYQILVTPETVTVVQEIEAFLSSQQPLVTRVNNGERTAFEIDPGARVVLVVFIGGIALVGISSVLHALLSGGIALLRFAREEP